MKRNITITPDNTLHNSGNESFKNIKTFKKACEILDINYNDVNSVIEDIIKLSNSKSAAAMFKLSVIRRALNLGQDLPFTKNSKNPCIYFPYIPCINEDSTLYMGQLNSGKMEIIGKIKVGKTECNILGGGTTCCYAALGFYDTYEELVGCASKEIAEHFSKYFGMTIVEARYSNLENFEIITNYYKN